MFACLLRCTVFGNFLAYRVEGKRQRFCIDDPRQALGQSPMLIQLSPEHMHHMSQIINILPFGLIGSCYFVLQPLKTLVATFVASLSNRGVMVCICKDTVSECMFTIVSSSLYFGFF